jgi:hypothetical protein
MLKFAVDYKAALNMMTANVENNLRAYEMNVQEWGLASELCNVLKVRNDSMMPLGWPV